MIPVFQAVESIASVRDGRVQAPVMGRSSDVQALDGRRDTSVQFGQRRDRPGEAVGQGLGEISEASTPDTPFPPSPRLDASDSQDAPALGRNIDEVWDELDESLEWGTDDLELETEGAILAAGQALAGDPRVRDGLQLLLVNGSLVGRPHEVFHQVLADLGTELLLEDVDRHLAWPEALHADSLADLAKAVAEFLLELVAGDGEGHLGEGGAGGFDVQFHG